MEVLSFLSLTAQIVAEYTVLKINFVIMWKIELLLLLKHFNFKSVAFGTESVLVLVAIQKFKGPDICGIFYFA